MLVFQQTVVLRSEGAEKGVWKGFSVMESDCQLLTLLTVLEDVTAQPIWVIPSFNLLSPAISDECTLQTLDKQVLF